LLQFKREFRRVTQLVHRNVVRLYELIEESDQWFFTMELVRGSHLLDYLRMQPASGREAGLRSTFSQLATAVEVLHGAGIIHRDIKPSNVMVDPGGRVVLLDFGIAKEIGPADARVTSALLGTPDYLAPERLHRVPAREPSDWYSVGVMLYQALTGKLPFEGDWLRMAVENQDHDVPPPRSIASAVPQDLSDLCLALLSRRPEKRPGAAEIRARLNAADSILGHHDGLRPPARRDASLLVARTGQLELLRQALNTVGRGRPAAVHVTGPSGIGKTTLVERFLAEVRERDSSATILVGACHQQESVAFNALDEFVDRLTDYLEHLPPGPPILLPSQSALIGRVFPVFKRVSVLDVSFASGAADPVETRRQAFAALRTLLRRLSARSTLIIAIDDLQWADRDSGSFLEELLRAPDAPPLMLILSYRRQSSNTNDLIDRLRQSHEASDAVDMFDVELTDLSPTDAQSLIRHLVDQTATPFADHALQRIADEAAGSPFLIHRLAQRVLASPDRIGEISNATLISEELERLTSAQRRLIELVAVARQPVPVDVAAKAAMSTAGSIDLGQLFATRLLQMQRRGPEELIDIYHDRIRKQLLDGLSAESKAVHHHALIDALEAVRPHESERLAYHYELGGQPDEASVYALTAAHQASGALAFDKAVNLYKRALTLGRWDLDVRQEIELDLAHALANAGRGMESAQAFLSASEKASGIVNIRLRIKAADQHLRSGYLTQGQALLRRLLDEVNLRWTERPSVMITSMLFNRVKARWLMRRIDDDAPVAESEHEMARMEVVWAAALGLSMFDPVSSADFSARHLVFAIKNRNPYRLALALAGEATQCAHKDGGREGRPQELLQNAMRYARRSGAAHAVAFVHCMAGIAAFLGGKWSESATESERALNLFREHCIGVSWDTATAASFMCASNVFRGRLMEHGRLLPTLVADARARGDIYAAEVLPALTLSWVQHLITDNPAAAAAELADWPSVPSRTRWRIQDTNALAARADIAVYSGDPRRAWTLMNEYWPSVTRSLMVRVITIRVLLLLTRAKCAIALALADDVDSAERATLLRAAERAARSLEATHCGSATPNRATARSIGGRSS
jgi:eukaryotic-like serine/threonine-protein kinase